MIVLTFQGVIRYGLTGQYFSASFYFMINETTGDIHVRSPLSTDTALSYTVCTEMANFVQWPDVLVII